MPGVLVSFSVEGMAEQDGLVAVGAGGHHVDRRAGQLGEPLEVAPASAGSRSIERTPNVVPVQPGSVS
jgi:hypothetical protein